MNSRPLPEETADELERRAQDLELVRMVLAGDPVALERFVARMQFVPRVLSILNARCGRRLQQDDLKDLAQEALTAIWGSLAEYEGRSKLETWTQRFCFHVFTNHGRRLARERERRVLGEGATEVEDRPAPEIFERLKLEVGRLGPPTTDVIRMKHEDEMTFEEIGTRLVVSSSTVKAWYYRGLSMLRDRLEEGDA